MNFLETVNQKNIFIYSYNQKTPWEVLSSICFKYLIIFYQLHEILINPEKNDKIIVGNHSFSTYAIFSEKLSHTP